MLDLCGTTHGECQRAIAGQDMETHRALWTTAGIQSMAGSQVMLSLYIDINLSMYMLY